VEDLEGAAEANVGSAALVDVLLSAVLLLLLTTPTLVGSAKPGGKLRCDKQRKC
jgi:hypothetical protein